MVNKEFLALTAAIAFAVGSAACDNTARGAREDAAEAQREATEAQQDASEAAARAQAEVSEEADDARRTAAEAGTAVDAARETIDVKTALMADKAVDASNINVDTVHETKTVVLKGHVPNAGMKEEAARIAQREATGYRVDNQLTVRP